MATRRDILVRTDSTRDPLTSFYEGLGRLAAEEGEFFEASRAYRRARFFALFTAGRSGGRSAAPTSGPGAGERGGGARNR